MGRLTFIWSQDESFFEPYHLAAAEAERFFHAADKARDALAQNGGVAALARAGHELYRLLFRDGAAERSVPAQVQEWLHSQQAIDSLEIVSDMPGGVPWNVVCASDQVDLEGFWGVRYPLAVGRRVNPLRLSPVIDNPKVLLVLHPGLPEERREAWQKECSMRSWQIVTSGFQLMKSIEEQCPDVLYFGGRIEGGGLTLGAEKISLRELRGWIDAAEDGSVEPLVFLDAKDEATGWVDFVSRATVIFPGLIAWETPSGRAEFHGTATLNAILQGQHGIGKSLQELRRTHGAAALGLSAYCPPGTRFTGEAAAEGVAYPLPETPYRPLAAYDREDRPLFMGRDRDVFRFTSLLDEAGSGLVLLHGTASAGKSSFLRAGVVPFLEDDCVGFLALRDRAPEEGITAEVDFPVLSLRGAADLAGQFAEALCAFCAQPLTYATPGGGQVRVPLPDMLRDILQERIIPGAFEAIQEGQGSRVPTSPSAERSEPVQPVDLYEVLRDDATLLGRLLDRLTRRLPQELVILIEQGEEIVTQIQAPANKCQARASLEMLTRAAAQSPRCKIILSLRTDFLGRLSDEFPQDSDPARPAGPARFQLPELSREQLEEAILLPTSTAPVSFSDEVPAAKYQFGFAADFARQLVSQVSDEAKRSRQSATALLQVVCARLYEHAKKKRLASVGPRDLKAIGGVEDAVVKLVDARLQQLELPRPSRRALKQLFDTLYTSHADGTFTRCLLPIKQMENHWPGGDVAAAHLAVNAAVEAGFLEIQQLLVAGKEATFVSPTQDALAQMTIDLREGGRRRKFGFTRIIDTLWIMIPLMCLAMAITYLFVKVQFGAHLKEQMDKHTEEVAEQVKHIQARFAKQVGGLAGPLYLASLPQVQQAYQSDNLVRMRQLLLSQQFLPVAEDDYDLRGFEWYYLWRLANSQRLLLEGHAAPVQAVAVSPDGQLAASASREGKLFLWDLATGKKRATLGGHAGAIHGLAFSADGKTLASAGADKIIKLWDAQAGKKDHAYVDEPGKTLTAHTAVVLAVVFRENELISASADKTILFWDLAKATPRQTLKDHDAAVQALAVAPKTKVLASADAAGKVILWDAAAKKLQQLDAKGAVRALAFTADGTTLATGGSAIRLWDADGKPRTAPDLKHGAEVFALTFSPDSKTLLSGGKDHLIRLWDAEKYNELGTIKGHLGWVASLALSADGRNLVTGSFDATVKVWSPRPTGTSEVLKPGSADAGPLAAVAISGDDKLLAAAGKDGKIHLWNLATGKYLEAFKDLKAPVTALVFNSSNRELKLAATTRSGTNASDGETKAWDIKLSDKDQLEAKEIFSSKQPAECLAFSPTEATLAFGQGKEVVLWDLDKNKKIRQLDGHDKTVRCVAYSPDGEILAGGGDDGTIRLWIVDSGRELPASPLTGHVGPVLSMHCFVHTQSLDKAKLRVVFLVSGGTDETLRLWSLGKSKELSRYHHLGPVTGVASASNGMFSASADHTIKIWGLPRADPAALEGKTETEQADSLLATMRLQDDRLTLQGHIAPVRALAVAADNQSLATVGDDGAVRLWRAAPASKKSERQKE